MLNDENSMTASGSAQSESTTELPNTGTVPRSQQLAVTVLPPEQRAPLRSRVLMSRAPRCQSRLPLVPAVPW